jgi:hypothetical protein
LTSATCSGTGRSSKPKNVVSAPNGTTANAVKAAAAEMIGASANRIGSADFGCRYSFIASLMMSASGCSMPAGPTSVGPMRCWMRAATLRST